MVSFKKIVAAAICASMTCSMAVAPAYAAEGEIVYINTSNGDEYLETNMPYGSVTRATFKYEARGESIIYRTAYLYNSDVEDSYISFNIDSSCTAVIVYGAAEDGLEAAVSVKVETDAGDVISVEEESDVSALSGLEVLIPDSASVLTLSLTPDTYIYGVILDYTRACADFSALKEAVELAEQVTDLDLIYTEETADAFQKEYDKAVEVLENYSASQEEIDSQTEALLAAIEALEELVIEEAVVDKTDLAAVIEIAEEINEVMVDGLYADESYDAYLDAYEKALEVYENEEATQEEVDAATEELIDAIEGLEEVEIDEDLDDSSDSDNNCRPQTGCKRFPKKNFGSWFDGKEMNKQNGCGAQKKISEIKKNSNNKLESYKKNVTERNNGCKAEKNVKNGNSCGQLKSQNVSKQRANKSQNNSLKACKTQASTCKTTCR